MDKHAAEEIDNFYNWSRDYWCELSSDQTEGSAGLLNFGCWDKGAANLYQAQQRLFDIFVELIQPLVPGSRGLEIGCGLGGNSIRLCENNPLEMTALDISEGQLEIASNRALEAGCESQIRFVQGSSMDMPFDDETFDFSICIESTFHYSKLNLFVAEQRRVLKPGAKAVIADITCEDPSRIKFRQGNYFYPVSYMTDLLAKNDLEIISMRRIGSCVFDSLYDHMRQFNKGEKSKLGKYWNLVLSNYSSLSRKGLMDYVIFEIRK